MSSVRCAGVASPPSTTPYAPLRNGIVGPDGPLGGSASVQVAQFWLARAPFSQV